jgi:hypothetical protein
MRRCATELLLLREGWRASGVQRAEPFAIPSRCLPYDGTGVAGAFPCPLGGCDQEMCRRTPVTSHKVAEEVSNKEAWNQFEPYDA